jgi:hypothetical protein
MLPVKPNPIRAPTSPTSSKAGESRTDAPMLKGISKKPPAVPEMSALTEV